MGKLDEFYGLLANEPNAAKAIQELQELNEKHNIRPDMIYSAFDIVTPDGAFYSDRIYRKLADICFMRPEVAYEYLNMIMRNQKVFRTLRDNILGERNAQHKYKDFVVKTHNLMYHGTPLKNYETIMEQREICITDYSVNLDPVEFDPNNFDANRSGTGMVYVTDSIDMATKFALKENKGVILCLDLYGRTLKRDVKDMSGSREFMSDDIIPIDCLRKVYSVRVTNRQIVLNEMEITR